MNIRLRQAGFSLLEIGVVLIILTVLLAGLSTSLVARQEAENLRNTRTKMTLIETALVQFVIQNRRLPCPADGRIATGSTNAGVERRSGTQCDTLGGSPGSQTHGVVPWVSLGISEPDATDEWGQRFTYRAGALTTGDQEMNMFWCDPAATPTTVPSGASSKFKALPDKNTSPSADKLCFSSCTASELATKCDATNNFLATRGLKVEDGAMPTSLVLMDPDPLTGALVGPTIPTGAAFVIISHGKSGGGGYTQAGSLRTSSSTDGTAEQRNYANLPLQTAYFDAAYSEVAGTGHFDDLVLRPSVLTVSNRAGLGPRPHP